MEVRNCKMCSRLFNYIGGKPICPACKTALEEKFQEVKKYVGDHKNAPLAEVAEANDVSVKQIKEWIREERLMLSEANGEIVCDNCGQPITYGRFCENCKKTMSNSLEGLYKKEEPQFSTKSTRDAHARMRFLDN